MAGVASFCLLLILPLVWGTVLPQQLMQQLQEEGITWKTDTENQPNLMENQQNEEFAFRGDYSGKMLQILLDVSQGYVTGESCELLVHKAMELIPLALKAARTLLDMEYS